MASDNDKSSDYNFDGSLKNINKKGNNDNFGKQTPVYLISENFIVVMEFRTSLTLVLNLKPSK